MGEVYACEVGIPNLLSLSTFAVSNFNASANVYGCSLLTLSRGVSMRLKKPFRVLLALCTVIEDIETGRVELVSI